MQRLFLIILACLALLVAGCGSDSSSSTSSSSTTAKTSTAKEEGEAKKEAQPKNEPGPTVNVPKGPPPKKLEIKELRKGTGPTAKAGDEVTVHYTGVLYDTGETFDSSWARGEPFTFKLGENLVIQGWEKGVEGMKAGGRRELIIPPQLGYGSSGTLGIPGNSTLVFVIDLLKIK